MKRLLLLTLAAALTVSGCNGGDDEETTPTTVDEEETTTTAADEAPACPLTTEVVNAVTGQTMEVVTGDECSWDGSTETAVLEVHYTSVSVDVFSAEEAETVEGVGDEAYLGPSGELYVRSGDQAFSIQVLAVGSDVDATEAQKELALKVLEEM